MSDSRYLFRGSIINMAGMGLRTALSPLALLLPRFFPQDIFGVFVSLRSVVNVCRTLFVFDFKRSLAWWIPRRQAEGDLRNAAVWSAAVFAGMCSILGSLVLGLAFLFFSGFLPKGLRGISPVFLFACLASIPGMVALDCACGCMDGIRRPKYSAFFGASFSIALQPIFAILMHFLGMPHSLAWSLFAANWLCALIVLWRMKEYFPTGGEHPGFLPERRLLEYSIPTAFSNWTMSGLQNFDLWLVALLIGPVESGIYGVMQMLANGVLKIRQTYDPLIVPVVSRMEEDSIHKKLPEVMTYSTHMVSSLQLVVALFLVCFHHEILLISGAKFAQFGTVFILLTASNLAGGFSGICYQALLGLRQSAMLFKSNLALLGIALAAGYMLVPAYGMLGAASISLFITILQTGILLYRQTRLHGKWPYRREFLLGIARIGTFIVASLLAAPWVNRASLLSRGSVFVLFALCLGAWAFAVRRSFIPSDGPQTAVEEE